MIFNKKPAQPLVLFCLLTFAFCLASCEEFFDQVITVEPPEYEKKMILNCFQNQLDSSIYISVTRNVGILETIPDSAFSIRDAKVEWLEGGNVLHTMTSDDFSTWPGVVQGFSWRYYGKNTGAPVVTPGKTYEIRVSHPDYPAISAVQVAPFPPKIDTITVKLDTASSNFFDGSANFSITIDDPAAESNFYEIGIFSEDGYSFYDLRSDDPNTRSGRNYDWLLVSDEFFNGKKYVLRVSNSAVDADVWVVKVRAVTADYYRFSSTAPQNEEASFNPFANPVQVFTNVTGGLGIFGLSGETEYVVE